MKLEGQLLNPQNTATQTFGLSDYQNLLPRFASVQMIEQTKPQQAIAA